MIERLTTAGVLIRGGNFLVAKRQKGGPLSEMWEFIGGKNRYGESLEETLKREWREEVSLDISVGDFLLKTDFFNKDVHYTLHCFIVTTTSFDYKINVHQALRWVGKNELRLLSFGPSDSVIRDYLIDSDL